MEQNDATAVINVSGLRKGTVSEFGSVTGQLWVVDVSIRGVEGTFDVNPLFMAARSAKGDSFDAALGATDGQLTTGTVTAGQRLRGVVGFDVTAGKTIESILWESPLGDQEGVWKV